MDAEYRLSAKRVELNILEVEIEDEDLWESEKYQRLKRQISVLKEQVDGEQVDEDNSGSERIIIGAGD